MTKSHQQPQNQSPDGQGFRRSNSIGGITKLTRRRIRRQQRRSQPYPDVFPPARRSHLSSTRGHCSPSSERTHISSETPRGEENASRGRYDVSGICSDDKLNLSWAVTDVSTPRGRKLIIKRCDAVANRKKENVPLATRHLKNGRRRKRLVSVRQNYSDKISSSDESVEECALGRPCHESAPLTPLSSKDENRFHQDFLLAENDVQGVGSIASESDVTATDCRRLRRANTLILDRDETNDGVRGGQTVTKPVTKSVTKPASKPVTSLDYDSLFDVLDHVSPEHQHNDVLETAAERFSYKTSLRPVEHFRCVLCETNLEALTLGAASLDILDMSRFHIQDGRSEVTLFCPECGFSQIGYR